MSRTKFIQLLFFVFIEMCASADVTDNAHSKYIEAFPEIFDATGNVSVQFECTAELDKFNLIYWYQIKGSKHVLLNVTQNIDEYSNITVTLHKTLEDSDRDNELYCVKENHTTHATCKEIVKWIRLSFEQNIKPVDTVVSIEPSSNILHFEADNTFTFVCTSNGPAPTDGARLTWYLENYPEQTHKESPDTVATASVIEIPEHQKYNKENNENILILTVNESHNLKRLFCALDNHKYIEHSDGKTSIIRFNLRKKSETITLVLRESTETIGTRTTSSTPGLNWIVPVLGSTALLLFVSLILVIIHFKRQEAEFRKKERIWTRDPLETPNENVYDSVYAHGAGLKRKRVQTDTIQQK